MTKADLGINRSEQDQATPPSRRTAILTALGVAAVAALPTSAAALETSDLSNLFEWEAFDLRKHIAAIDRDLSPFSGPSLGERAAAAINSKSKTSLAEIAGNLSDENGEELVDLLLKTEENLATRYALVQCAIGRLASAAKVIG